MLSVCLQICLQREEDVFQGYRRRTSGASVSRSQSSKLWLQDKNGSAVELTCVFWEGLPLLLEYLSTLVVYLARGRVTVVDTTCYKKTVPTNGV